MKFTKFSPGQCDQMFNGRSIHLKRNKPTEAEILKIISQENVRDLLVPVPNNAHPSIFPSKEIKRMKTAGHEFSKNERLAKVQEFQDNKKRLEEECERRKLLMKEIDRVKAEKGKSASEIPVNEIVRGKILDRAFVAQQEQVCIVYW